MRDNDRAFGQNNCVFVLGLAKTHFSPSSAPCVSALSVEYICLKEERSCCRGEIISDSLLISV